MLWLFNENTCAFDVADEKALSDPENIVIRSHEFDFEIYRQGKKSYWREDEHLELFGNVFYRDDFELILNRLNVCDFDEIACSVKSK